MGCEGPLATTSVTPSFARVDLVDLVLLHHSVSVPPEAATLIFLTEVDRSAETDWSGYMNSCANQAKENWMTIYYSKENSEQYSFLAGFF